MFMAEDGVHENDQQEDKCYARWEELDQTWIYSKGCLNIQHTWKQISYTWLHNKCWYLVAEHISKALDHLSEKNVNKLLIVGLYENGKKVEAAVPW